MLSSANMWNALSKKLKVYRRQTALRLIMMNVVVFVLYFARATRHIVERDQHRHDDPGGQRRETRLSSQGSSKTEDNLEA